MEFEKWLEHAKKMEQHEIHGAQEAPEVGGTNLVDMLGLVNALSGSVEGEGEEEENPFGFIIEPIQELVEYAVDEFTEVQAMEHTRMDVDLKGMSISGQPEDVKEILSFLIDKNKVADSHGDE
ncbi:hypothetical protein [Geomicrobium sp. JCM 19055]|uniref:hypothetical protein n=1 Tax=Geomicrobium sp. JCM 19055 TaxID=1460649 RepID=UPI00045EDDFB|nr:hypothetical protein [Geomicrobium sp. JCM 19055]GAK00879.1 hypothetical protein JCM19055_4000 [Geomicrobium sp. JCM 19055]